MLKNKEKEVYELFLTYKFFDKIGIWTHEGNGYKSYFIHEKSNYYESIIRMFKSVMNPTPPSNFGVIKYHFLILFENDVPMRLYVFFNLSHFYMKIGNTMGIGLFPKFLDKSKPPKPESYRLINKKKSNEYFYQS